MLNSFQTDPKATLTAFLEVPKRSFAIGEVVRTGYLNWCLFGVEFEKKGFCDGELWIRQLLGGRRVKGLFWFGLFVGYLDGYGRFRC
jgi:hypothetical protein